jgi:cell division protein FtsL
MRYAINLLPSKVSDSLGDRAFYFILNYLRYIIVLTQLVVIFVFIAKFSTDQQIVDLQESIDQKNEIITVFQPLVKDASTVRFKTDQISSILKRQQVLPQVLTHLIAGFPKDFFLEQLIIREGTLTISGYTTRPLVLQAYYQKMKRENLFESIDLKDIKKGDVGYDFEIQFKNFKGT